ncbi:hypothetical protein LWI29_029780 [Acer saccharum]|uniref:Protein kinase domain-containing protein n=2 Tax=Acereae TaxID=1977919 RepID=A0AA39SZL6_ACESA|nr:hypothetical protein LWI29_029780 [Acer saccharum]
MNHYHIYEAIGRGKYSSVYKGRKKKTIEYFAIKSVDKSQKSKVLQEDNQLPEESIHDLARDLVRALQYLHSKGIMYCDLKPSNILLDENGRTKLPQAKRGTPSYMAPELFEDGGVHSYASDLWALGCVLFECYAGRPPFVGKEFTQLVRSILSDPTPPLPVKGTPSGRKNQTKVSGRGVEEKLKDPSSATRRVNLLRMSRIAKTNLQRENEKENYRRPLPNESENESEVKIENTDMELDFDENNEDETHDELDGSDNPPCTTEEKSSSQTQLHGKAAEEAGHNLHHLHTPRVDNMPVSDESTNDRESSSEHVEVAATPPSVSPQFKTQRIKEGSGPALDAESSRSSNSLSQVIWHPSDLSVRPVMPSRKADKVSEVFPSLPFEALQASDFVKISKEQLDALSNRIIAIFNGNTSVGEKQNVIRYLEMLSNNADAANILTNGPIMLMLVKMLRLSKTPALRVQLASLIGLLIRHSTFIDDDLANSGILGSLTDGLRSKQEKVRRFSMAALGELLFYISTQNDHARDNNPPESPSKNSRTAPGWQVPNSLISLVSAVLRKGEDDMTQLYALRTIENICSQGGHWVTRFTSQDVISNLCYIYRAAGKQESMRLTAGSFHEQQISLNLLNMAMLGSHMFTNIGRHLLPLVEDKNLIPSLVSLIEQGSEVLRGKALLFVAFLCKNGKRWMLHFLCNARLISTVDRLAKEKDSFVQQCLDAYVHVVVSIIPGLLDTITGDIQQMMGGRRHGHISALTNRTAPKTNVHLFPVILHLLGSSSFKNRVVNPPVLRQLANLIRVVETPFQGRDDFQITLLRILESIAEESSIILGSPDIFVLEILPSLTVLYKENKELKSISNSHFLPLYPTLIEDEDPIPMYAQKLLVMLIEVDYIKISNILDLKTVSQCFEFLLGDLSSANVNSVKLCLALASAPEMESKLLSQIKVVRRIGNLLEYAYAKDMEDFLEPTLGLCRAFLLRSVGSGKSFTYTKEPALLGDCSSEFSGALDQQHCIRDIMDFGGNVGVLLELSGLQEANVADVASECVVLLLKAAPREATTGFLTNLPKVSTILESWHRGIPHLILQRMLHALGYSCRQYLSHAMILSISVPDVSRIEATISQLKTSNIPALEDAASLAASELQRLPRCL